ncbi:MAG: prenyltransferase/squalene oxidase repeat-containing protein [Solirubrobacterales bacterium]
MSWELTSFVILGAVLFGGFAWYERSRPPSQVVALVAALAALAIAGRIAFAAFPNVKPTTDIVIFAGYALGGAPGFAVGALAALVSNFWFGQGPWTPWQMAGWGLCGVLGAAMAVGGRNAGRLSLAAMCGFAGIAYGALLNFSLMATYGGDLSLERFGVLMGRAIPFDAAHAIGNVALALVAGPAMVRMLVRFRERFEWGRGGGTSAPGPKGDSPTAAPPRRVRPAIRGGGVAGLLLVVLLVGALAPASADASRVSRAAGWLQSQQNADGGWGASPEKESGPEMTCWAMLALAAAGTNPLDVQKLGRSPVDLLRGHTDELTSPGDLARTILALESAGVDPRDFGGENLVSQLLAKRRDNGSYEGWPNSTAFAVMALRTAGVTGGLDKTLAWLRKVQNDDGGWGDVPGSPSTADGTGAVLQAISSESKAADRGVAYLRQAQRKGGGFPLGGNGPVNTQSTAWAIEGIRAAGADPDSKSFQKGGSSAVDYLAEHQESDGHYRYSGASDQTPIWVTSTVLVAAAGKSYPVPAPARKPKPKPQTSSSTSGGLPPSPVTPAPALESPVVPPSGSGSGGAGALPERSAPPGPQTPGASATDSPPAGGERDGSGTPAPEPPASESSTDSTAETAASDDSSSSTAGSIVLGLLAGSLLFGVAWAGRRGWMRWRYGL